MLEFIEVPTPAPRDNEVLVRVKAASINARDWHLMRGDPYLARLAMAQMGRKGPKTTIRGSDFAGVVEAVGSSTSRFRPGDEVYGDMREDDGAFAEYVSVPEALAEHKPGNVTFEEAAAVPLAGATALAGLRDVAKVQPGHRVLINGASGGVGTFAVQIAKSLGASVTAVCRTRNIELMRDLGADAVIDYTADDFATTGPYDVVFDLVGNRSLADLQRPLDRDGLVILSGGGVSGNGKNSLVGPMGLFIRARFSRGRVTALDNVVPGRHLAALKDLIESGSIKPVIDRMYPLSQAPDAIGYMETEHVRAKVVITVG